MCFDSNEFPHTPQQGWSKLPNLSCYIMNSSKLVSGNDLLFFKSHFKTLHNTFHGYPKTQYYFFLFESLIFQQSMVNCLILNVPDLFSSRIDSNMLSLASLFRW